MLSSRLLALLMRILDWNKKRLIFFHMPPLPMTIGKLSSLKLWLSFKFVWVHSHQTEDQVLRQISLDTFSTFALDQSNSWCWIFWRVQNTFSPFDKNKKINLYHQNWNGCLSWFLHRPSTFVSHSVQYKSLHYGHQRGGKDGINLRAGMFTKSHVTSRPLTIICTLLELSDQKKPKFIFQSKILQCWI